MDVRLPMIKRRLFILPIFDSVVLPPIGSCIFKILRRDTQQVPLESMMQTDFTVSGGLTQYNDAILQAQEFPLWR